MKTFRKAWKKILNTPVSDLVNKGLEKIVDLGHANQPLMAFGDEFNYPDMAFSQKVEYGNQLNTVDIMSMEDFGSDEQFAEAFSEAMNSEDADRNDFTLKAKAAKAIEAISPAIAKYAKPVLATAEAAAVLGIIGGFGVAMMPSTGFTAQPQGLDIVKDYYSNGGQFPNPLSIIPESPYTFKDGIAVKLDKPLPQRIKVVIDPIQGKYHVADVNGLPGMVEQLTGAENVKQVIIADNNKNGKIDVGEPASFYSTQSASVLNKFIDQSLQGLLYPPALGKDFWKNVKAYDKNRTVVLAAQPELAAMLSPVGVIKPVPVPLTSNDPNYVKAVVDYTIANRATRFSQALNIRKTSDTSLDICNSPAPGNITIENVDLGKNTQIAYDILNRFGFQFKDDVVITPEILRVTEQFLERYNSMDISQKNIRPIRHHEQLRTNPYAEFVDVVHRGKVGKTTSNTPALGYHRDFLYPGEMHILLLPATAENLGTPNANIVQEYCFAFGEPMLRHADLDYMKNGMPPVAPVIDVTQIQPQPVPVILPGPEPQVQVVPQPIVTVEVPLPQPQPDPKGKVPEPQTENVLLVGSDYGLDGKLAFRMNASGLYLPWKEKITTEVLDANGVPIEESQNMNVNYAGGQLVAGVNIPPLKWLELTAGARYLGGNGDSNVTQFEYFVGPSFKINNIGRLLAAYGGLQRSISLEDEEISLDRKIDISGGNFSFVSEDMLKNDPQRAVRLLLGYTSLTGKMKTDMTIDLSSLGIPNVEDSTSENYGISQFNGGVEAFLLPFANGKGNLGFYLGGSRLGITQGGDNQGLTMSSFDPRLKMLYKAGKSGLIEVELGYSPVWVKSEDNAVKKDAANYAEFALRYHFGLRDPSRFGITPN